MIDIQPARNKEHVAARPIIGLALAGGGPMGGTYEVGALMALNETLEGVTLNDMNVYVGVSSGALVASILANEISPARLCRMFVKNNSLKKVFNPELFFRPALGEYVKRAISVPNLAAGAVFRFVTHPLTFGVMESISGFNPALPTGIFDNNAINVFLTDTFKEEGKTNDFRKLRHKLYLMAVNLNTSEAVKFGSEGFDGVPISKAVQASAALPGLFPPVEIEGEHYVDGVLRKTLHASAALEEGAELVFCINPIVPFNANLSRGNGGGPQPENLVDGGLPMVLSQTFRTLIYSRMKTGMKKYSKQFPHSDVVLFEPNRNDSQMFFSNVFSFANRRKVCEHAYEATRRDLLTHREQLEPVLERHGLGLNLKILRQDRRDYFQACLEGISGRERRRKKAGRSSS